MLSPETLNPSGSICNKATVGSIPLQANYSCESAIAVAELVGCHCRHIYECDKRRLMWWLNLSKDHRYRNFLMLLMVKVWMERS